VLGKERTLLVCGSKKKKASSGKGEGDSDLLEIGPGGGPHEVFEASSTGWQLVKKGEGARLKDCFHGRGILLSRTEYRKRKKERHLATMSSDQRAVTDAFCKKS